MKNILMTVLITSCLLSGVALADDDCTDPISQWQPKEQLRQMMEDNGWEVKRIKVDDGCYEVRGFDRKGNHVKATFSPASLKIIELKIKFNASADASDYVDFDKTISPMESTNDKQKSKPAVSIK